MRVVVLVLCICIAFAAASHFEAKAHPRLRELFAKEKELSFMIHFDRALLPAREPHTGDSDEQEAEILHLRSATRTFHEPILERLRQLGVTKMKSFWVANFIQVTATVDIAREIATWPEVLHLEPNERSVRLRLPEQPTNATESQIHNESHRDGLTSLNKRNVQEVLWHHETMKVPALWDLGLTGQGIVVGSADTGVQYDHPALLTQYRGANGDHDYNWFDPVDDAGSSNPCGSNSPVPCDDNGHGTHTTGSAVGDDGAERRVGVAFDAKWIACRNMDRGEGRPLWYIECLQFMLAPTKRNGDDPQPSLRPHVIINSYACPEEEGCTDLNILKEAVDNVVAGGIFMAVAAGNTGPSCSTISEPPAIYPSSYTVGASDINNQLARFSSRGPVRLGGDTPRIGPHITAPGVAITSAFVGGGYQALSGTSMATPQIAGVVALLGQAYPSLQRDVQALGDMMEQTANRVSTSDCSSDATKDANNLYGFGIVDAEEAYLLLVTPTPSVSPQPSPSAGSTPTATPSRTPAASPSSTRAVSSSSIAQVTLDFSDESSDLPLTSLSSSSNNISPDNSASSLSVVYVMTSVLVLLFFIF